VVGRVLQRDPTLRASDGDSSGTVTVRVRDGRRVHV